MMRLASNFLLCTAVIALSSAAALPAAPSKKSLVKKITGTEAMRPALPTGGNLDNQGGPDAFGYRYVDNQGGDTAT